MWKTSNGGNLDPSHSSSYDQSTMCGRFTLHSQLNLILQQFALLAGPELAPRYNVAPTQQVPVIRLRPSDGQREMTTMRWGLVPSWAKELAIGNRMINARAETVASKPSFRVAFRKRRCLVPADGYFEWRKTPSGKQPYYIQCRDGGPFAMAGLWESWRSGQSEEVETFTVITTQANADTQFVHDRMPVILHSDQYATWLGGDAQDVSSIEPLLQPLENGLLQMTPVSTRVNNPRHDAADCILPLNET